MAAVAGHCLNYRDSPDLFSSRSIARRCIKITSAGDSARLVGTSAFFTFFLNDGGSPMKISLKPLDQQTIVITGASSGIGLATAQCAAKKGARVVLASRNEHALREAVRQIEEEGGQAIHVVADVSDREQLQMVANTARERFGGFDTWVNNAGVSIIGPVEKITDEDHRKLFETNYWGVVYGSLIAVEELKKRGGALINLGSVASDQTFILQGMYSATKHAVKAFTDALRVELEEEGAPVSVTLIKPTSIDTPFPQHARNYTDREPKLPPPVYSPEEVAQCILHAAAHPERDMYVGGSAKPMSAIGQNAPRLMDWINRKFISKEMNRDEPPRHPQGILYQAGEDGCVEGEHPGHVIKVCPITRAARHPYATGAALAVMAGAAVALGIRGTTGKRRLLG
jgi:short-subunit dehydrogenase